MTDLRDWLQPIDRAVCQSGRTRAVSLRRHYDTTPEDVWDAWTNIDRLRRWLGDVSGEPHEGGEIVLDMGDEQPVTCTILRCDPPKRLVATWSHPGQAESTVELTLAPDGGRTQLQLEHVGLDRAELARDYGEGWEDFLHGLGQYLRGVEKTSLSWSEVRAALDPYWAPLTDAPPVDGRWPIAEIDGDRATLTVQRTYSDPPAAVWAAITEPARLAEWFGAVETGLQDELDQLVGSARPQTWTVTFADGPGTATGTIDKCDAPRELVTSWQWDYEPFGSVVRVVLEPTDDGGTKLHLEERDGPATRAAGYAAGWYAKLAGLAIHLGGAKPTEADWDAAFAMASRTV